MSGRFARLVVFLVAAGLSTMVSSGAPFQAVRAMQARAVVVQEAGADTQELDAMRLRALVTPTPIATPSPTPAPTPSPAPTVVRLAATARPIPLPAVDAQEIALMNLDTGRFLWQSNARQAWAPASLTKIFTAMVAVDLMGLNATVTVPASISQLPAHSTFMGLSPGERVSVRELLYGVFLNSGNDAAETLASAVTSRATFIATMNAKASRLGLRTTHFVNPQRPRRRRPLFLGLRPRDRGALSGIALRLDRQHRRDARDHDSADGDPQDLQADQPRQVDVDLSGGLWAEDWLDGIGARLPDHHREPRWASNPCGHAGRAKRHGVCANAEGARLRLRAAGSSPKTVEPVRHLRRRTQIRHRSGSQSSWREPGR